MHKIIVCFILLIIPPASHSQQKDSAEYSRTRLMLTEMESSYKLGYEIELNKAEQKVNDYLLYLQKDFIEKSGFNFPSSHYFYKHRNIIDSSLIFRIIRLMPKGGVLHTHMGAIGSTEWLVKTASYYDNCYMYTGTDSINNVYGKLMFYNPGTEPKGWESLKNLRTRDSDFDSKLYELLTFSEKNYNSPVTWVEFEKIFTRLDGFVGYYPVFIAYNRNVIDSLIADNIQFYETRTFLSGIYDLSGKNYTQEEVLLIHKAVLDTVRMRHPEFNMKLIYSGYRGWDQPTILSEMVKAIELRKKYPYYQAGFDLVGEEDKGHTTRYFVNEFLKVDSLKRVYGVDLPFYFHDGESTLPSDDNLIDAVMLKTRRIGHGINLFRFPSLEIMVREYKIALEVCPLSNQILGYVQDLRMHPACEYINRGLPVTISSDDPQIFDYTGTSYDFFAAFAAWELDLQQLKQLAMNSIIYSAMNDEEKTGAIEFFSRRWDKFIKDATDIMEGR